MSKKDDKKGPRAVDPLREDDESQPNKGSKRGRQHTIPGAREAVVKFPDLDAAMAGLRDKREEWAQLGIEIDEARGEIMTLLHAHKIPSYVAHGLMVSIEPGEEELRIRKIKPPKDDVPEAAQA